jgi:hypothetical protein
MEALISVVGKMVSEAEIIISATDTAFAVSEKTVGGAPAVVFHQQSTIRSCEKRAQTPHVWCRFPAISRYPRCKKRTVIGPHSCPEKLSNSQHFWGYVRSSEIIMY